MIMKTRDPSGGGAATHDLEATARALVAPGKGILAADESTPTIAKRLKTIGVESTEETRRAYREMLLTTPGLGDFISGVILFDETLRQKTSAGKPFLEVLADQGILPGIKVDQGAKPLSPDSDEKVTRGLDGLPERLTEYAQLGARFTKWRAVIAIGPQTPTEFYLEANAQALARFAVLSQEHGLVPIVEPEVLMDGPHSIERHAEVTEKAIRTVFRALAEHRVRLPAMLLKPNMVLPGTESGERALVEQVAELTRATMQHVVPPEVPGLVFLSGGQSDLEATEHLDAMNRLGRVPWELSFSFGRALQAPALRRWAGRPENVTAAQRVLHQRARCNSAARFGRYSTEMEKAA